MKHRKIPASVRLAAARLRPPPFKVEGKSDYDLLLAVAQVAMKYTCARYDDEDAADAAVLELEIRLSTLPKHLYKKVYAKWAKCTGPAFSRSPTTASFAQLFEK